MSPQRLSLSDIDPVYLVSALTTVEPSTYEDDLTSAMSHQPQRTASTDSAADAIRKRVCKACDRCRLKKSKCDGSNPCSRCKADNAICVFGERKKSHDKVYPKGYVEMLEQQQEQLVSGLQEMYRRMRKGEPWSGPTLSETNGHPLTHDILAALGLLETKHDGSGDLETFEENVEKLQSKLIADGAGYVHRRGSFSSDSEHSQHSHQQPHGSTTHNTPSLHKPPIFDKNFSFASASPSPAASQSPMPRQRRSYPPPQQQHQQHSQPSPIPRTSQPLITSDPQLFQPEWTSFGEPATLLRSNFAMRTPQLDQSLDQLNEMFTSGHWEDGPSGPFDLTMGGMNAAYSQPFANGGMGPYQGGIPDYASMASMDLDSDFKQFIQVTT